MFSEFSASMIVLGGYYNYKFKILPWIVTYNVKKSEYRGYTEIQDAYCVHT